MCEYVTESTCWEVIMLDRAGKATRPPVFLFFFFLLLLFYQRAGDSQKVCTLLGGGELEGWKGLRIPAESHKTSHQRRGEGIWKIIPHFPS